jgi:hypothetical protein
VLSVQNSFNSLELQPEEQFLIYCLRLELGHKDAEEIKTIKNSDIDWDKVFQISRQLKFSPILYKAIKNNHIIQQSYHIPDTFIQKIKFSYTHSLMMNKINFKKLNDVLDTLCLAGVDVILLKGCHLAPFVFQDIGIRPMADIDIMVKDEDLLKAESLLFSIGYHYSKKFKDELKQSCLIERYKNKIYYNHLYPFYNSKGIKSLEVHWSFDEPTSPFHVDIEGAWKRAKPVKIKNYNVFILSPEDLILQLCIDVAFDHNYFSGLSRLFDISIAINHYADEIDWHHLQALAYKWKMEKCLYLTLQLTHQFLGLRLPNTMLSSLKQQVFNNKIVSTAQRRILLRETKRPMVRLYCPDKLNPDLPFSQRITFLFNRVFSSSKKELALRYSLPLSSKRIYLYYFVRLFSLVFKKFPLYISFFIYLVTHKKSDFFSYNIDTCLISESDNVKSKHSLD